MKKLYYLIPLIIACASPQSPSGGDKDVSTPLLALDSTLFTTNSYPKKITLQFDENIVVNKSEININPLIYPKPNIEVNNKSITIHIEPEALVPNTTYSISLNKAIKDLNEGNIGNYQPLLFATGNNIDTLSIKHTCLNYIDEQKKLIINDDINSYQFNFNKCCYTTINTPQKNVQKIEIFIDNNKNNLFDSTEAGNNLDIQKELNFHYLIEPLKNYTCYPYKGGIAAVGIPAIYNFMTNFSQNKDTTFITDLVKCPLEIKNRFKIKDSLTKSIQFTEIQEDTNYKIIKFNHKIQSINSDSTLVIVKNDTQNLNNINLILLDNELHIKNINNNEKIIFKTHSIQFDNELSNNNIINIKNTLNYGHLDIINTLSQPQNIVCFYQEKVLKVIEIPANSSKLIYLPLGPISLLVYEDMDKNGILNHPIQHKTKDKINLLINTECIKNMINSIQISQ